MPVPIFPTEYKTLVAPPRVVQIVVDPAGDEQWAIEGEVDLRHAVAVEEPLVRVKRIGGG